ncbi:MAG TPA: leucyl aminopeptidase family protein, partial [Tepidisphaeraceae bacterium]
MIPTSTDVTIRVQTKLPPQADAIVVFIAEGGRICGDAPHLLDEQTLGSVDRLIRSGVCRGKSAEIAFDLIDIDIDRGKIRRVFLAGVGKHDQIDQEAVRRSAGAIAKAVKKHRMRNVAIVPPVLRDRGHSGARSVVTGFLLASFQYDEYRGTAKKKEDPDQPGPISLTFLATPASIKSIRELVRHGQIISESQNFARTIAHRPGNDINPPALAKVAADMAREVGLKCRVLDEKQLKKLGMGGILAVGAGSGATPPRLIVLEHNRAKKKSKPLLVVGKAITFDTGGISIKPAEKMGKMVFDKCGGMTVLGAMCAIARLKLPVHVVGILSSAENHISENAFRPGDILRMYNGVTVEVTNTDAEGRLVLGDALAWGIETYKPAAVIDLATLTGGVITALGRGMAGVMSNDDSLVNELEEISKRSGEKFWRLPLGTE